MTSVENYQANGVIFKGNLRGDPSDAYERIAARLKVPDSCTSALVDSSLCCHMGHMVDPGGNGTDA